MSDKFDFNEFVDRRPLNASKYLKVKENEIPLTIADMDLPTAKEIVQALTYRASLGSFGYTEVPASWYQAYSNFYSDIYDFYFEKKHMMFVTGVVPAISSTVRKFTNPGDNVVVLSPVYNIFYNSIINNNRVVKEVPLIYKDGKYSIDFDNLEKALKLNNTKLLILCNPHNPVGRIWTEKELMKIGDLCYQNGVVVLSDEIHGPVTRPNKKYIPFANVSAINQQISITALSPTKAFSLAGIQTACIICFNPDLYKKINRQINTDEVAEPNCFATIAAETSYNYCRDFLKQQNKFLFDNRDYAVEYISTNLPIIEAIKGDASYLLWIDISNLRVKADEFVEYLRKDTGLILTSGSVYRGNADYFVRMNLAVSRPVLEDALNRLYQGIEDLVVKKKKIK